MSAAGDPGGGRSDVMQAMADSMPSATHVAISHAGHICNIENPGAFNDTVVDFIRSVSSAPHEVTTTSPPNGRLRRLVANDLDDDQRSLFDEIVGGPRSRGRQMFRLTGHDGALEGPFNAFLRQPQLGRALQAVGAAVRYQGLLSDRCRELAILVVAHRWDSAFEWYAHEAVGRHIGLRSDDLDAVVNRDYSRIGDPVERVLVATTDLLAWEGDLNDDAYSEAVSALGERELFELVTLVGYYANLALQLRVFRVGVPNSHDPAPPEGRC